MKKLCALFLLLCLSLAYSEAQLVNIEKLRKTRKEGLQGEISVGLNLKKNTKQILTGKTGLGVQYTTKGHTMMFFNDFNYLDVKDSTKNENLINEGFEHFRYNYTFPNAPWFTWESFVQHQFNRIKLLKIRFITGGGPRFTLVKSERLYLNLCPLFMYEYEYLNLTDTITGESNYFKGDFYISGNYVLSKTADISHTTYYQPVMRYWRDFRISSETSLNLKITDRMTFSLVLNYDYDADPPRDQQGKLLIPRDFYNIMNTIRFTF